MLSSMNQTTLNGKHQTVIKKNLSHFILNFKPKEANNALATALITHGFCFGFTLCHMAMEYLEKLEWWESILTQSALWDKSPSKLELKLPVKELDKSETLESAFLKLSDFIPYHYVTREKEGGIKVDGLTQPALLEPGSIFFEIQRENKETLEVHKIFKRACASGNLTDQEILSLLDPAFFSNILCMVHSPKHALRIGYVAKLDRWLVYDPNYPVEKLHQTFKKKEDAYFELKNRISNKAILCLDLLAVGTTEDPKKAAQLDKFMARYYNIIKDKDPCVLLQDGGLIVIIKYNPEVLCGIFEKMKDEKYENHVKLSHIIAEALVSKLQRNDTTYLCSMAQHAPQCFSKLVEVIECEKDLTLKNKLIESVKQGLLHKNKKDETGLEFLLDKDKLKAPVMEWLADSTLQLPELKSKNDVTKSNGLNNIYSLIEIADSKCQGLFSNSMKLFSSSPITFASEFSKIKNFINRLILLDYTSTPVELTHIIIKKIEDTFEKEFKKINKFIETFQPVSKCQREYLNLLGTLVDEIKSAQLSLMGIKLER